VQTPDIVTLHRLWSETDCRLDSLLRQVAEGAGVDEASNFARWLDFSGILQLLEPFACDVPLRVDAAGLAAKVRQLKQDCGEWYSLHERSFKRRDAYISVSKLEAIEEELRQLKYNLSELDKKFSPFVGQTSDAGIQPALSVLPDGEPFAASGERERGVSRAAPPAP